MNELVSLRVALFSGNYNCTRDGANNALNHLGGYLLEHGAALRVYSPTVPHPAFPPAGDLVGVPSIPIPGRPEYRLALGLPRRIRDDIAEFAPTVIHLSAPDPLNRAAQRFARGLGCPVVASVHTRFETYFEYYGLKALRPLAEAWLRHFYRACDLVLIPSEAIAEPLRRWGLGGKLRIWSRGVDCRLFAPSRRDPAVRRKLGVAEGEVAVLFFGHVVREKGLETFAGVIDTLRVRGLPVRPLVIGDGPDRAEFEKRLGSATFTGELTGEDLAAAVASADIMVNPSLTEAFGNVNLEAMASGVPVVSADAPAARVLFASGRNGILVPGCGVEAYADAVEQLAGNALFRERIAADAVRSAAARDWDSALAQVVAAYRDVTAIPNAAAAFTPVRRITRTVGHTPTAIAPQLR